MDISVFIVIALAIFVLRWLSRTFPEVASPSSTANNKKPLAPALSGGDSKMEIVRQRLQAMYFEKKISLDALNELTALLKAPAPAPARAVEDIPAPVTPTGSSERPAARQFTPETSRPAVIRSAPAAVSPSGYLASDNIKTLLISGAALFVLSGYLFVRSYWAFISAVVKYATLAAVTLAMGAIGKTLRSKGKTPNTAETILLVTALLVPFNVYAANVLLFDQTMTPATWMFAALALCAVASLLAMYVSTARMSGLAAVGWMGACLFGASELELSSQSQFLFLSAGTALLFLVSDVLLREARKTGAQTVVGCSVAAVLLGLAAHGFYWWASGQLPTVGTLTIIGVVAAVLGRRGSAPVAYVAGLCTMGAIALLLRENHVPLYKFGLSFVPVGFAATWRAWHLERSGKSDLGAPYFHLGQVAIAASLLATLPDFSFYVGAGFSTLAAILVVAAAAYASIAVLFGNKFFMAAGGGVLLFFTGVVVLHSSLAFTSGLLLFSMVSWIFLLVALSVGRLNDEVIAGPLIILGLGTLSVCGALLAGLWGNSFFATGSFHAPLAPDQLNTGLWVASMGLAAYALLARLQRQTALVFPALACATFIYVLALEKAHVALTPVNAAWIAAVSAGAFYFLRERGPQLARCFAVWAELALAILLLGSLVSPSDDFLRGLLIGIAAFAPALWIGRMDMVTSCLISLYAAHLDWFRIHVGLVETLASEYAFQLLPINCAVVLVRTVIGMKRPQLNLIPYRTLALVFSCISLVLALDNASTAWQIYLAYGVLALVVDALHYENQFWFVGTTLLLAAYELFLHSQSVALIEAYTVPAGAYVLACGYLCQENKSLRNLLFAVAHRCPVKNTKSSTMIE